MNTINYQSVKKSPPGIWAWFRFSRMGLIYCGCALLTWGMGVLTGHGVGILALVIIPGFIESQGGYTSKPQAGYLGLLTVACCVIGFFFRFISKLRPIAAIAIPIVHAVASMALFGPLLVNELQL